MIGEATHGTHEFYRHRAVITKRLIEEKGFTAVAVEADWPDAYRVNRWVQGADDDPDAERALGGFERFPTWMWRNADVLDFVGWLRSHNERTDRPTGFYGLDLYSLYRSIEAVVEYLDRIDPAAAARARERYACLERFEESQAYGYSAARGLTQSCRAGRPASARRAPGGGRGLPSPRRDRRGGRAFLRGGERAAGRRRRAVLPVDVHRADLLLEPPRQPHGRDAGAADRPPRGSRARPDRRLGPQLPHRGRPADFDGAARRAQHRPAGARALGPRSRPHRFHDLHRHGQRSLRLGGGRRAQARPAAAPGQRRGTASARSATMRSGCGSATTGVRQRSSSNHGSSGRSASSTGPRTSSSATTSKRTSPSSSTTSSTSTRPGRSSPSNEPSNGSGASHPRPIRPRSDGRRVSAGGAAAVLPPRERPDAREFQPRPLGRRRDRRQLELGRHLRTDLLVAGGRDLSRGNARLERRGLHRNGGDRRGPVLHLAASA